MKTKIINMQYCENNKCRFCIGGNCITNPEVDNHKKCLSCTDDKHFKVKS